MKNCKNCDYYVNNYGYGQCYAQKDAPRVDDDDCCEDFKEYSGTKSNDTISRSALEKSMRKSINERYVSWSKTITVADIATLIFDEISNTPTVEGCFTTKDLEDSYIKGKESGRKEKSQDELLDKVKEIVDDYITSYNNGWLCGGDENKTVFKSYYFDKIMNIFVNQE